MAGLGAGSKVWDHAGVVCLMAEYGDRSLVNRLIAEGITFAKALIAQGGE